MAENMIHTAPHPSSISVFFCPSTVEPSWEFSQTPLKTTVKFILILLSKIWFHFFSPHCYNSSCDFTQYTRTLKHNDCFKHLHNSSYRQRWTTYWLNLVCSNLLTDHLINTQPSRLQEILQYNAFIKNLKNWSSIKCKARRTFPASLYPKVNFNSLLIVQSTAKYLAVNHMAKKCIDIRVTSCHMSQVSVIALSCTLSHHSKYEAA